MNIVVGDRIKYEHEKVILSLDGITSRTTIKESGVCGIETDDWDGIYYLLDNGDYTHEDEVLEIMPRNRYEEEKKNLKI